MHDKLYDPRGHMTQPLEVDNDGGDYKLGGDDKIIIAGMGDLVTPVHTIFLWMATVGVLYFVKIYVIW